MANKKEASIPSVFVVKILQDCKCLQIILKDKSIVKKNKLNLSSFVQNITEIGVILNNTQILHIVIALQVRHHFWVRGKSVQNHHRI